MKEVGLQSANVEQPPPFARCAGGPILIAWMADFTPDPSQRALILGLTPTCSFAVDSFANSACIGSSRLLCIGR